MFVIYNDHLSSFFFDHYSAFCLGIGEEYSVADEGSGARAPAADQRAWPAHSPVALEATP